MNARNYNGSVSCRDCGKPIVFADEYGMFCADKCGRAESIRIGKAVKAALAAGRSVASVFSFLKRE